MARGGAIEVDIAIDRISVSTAGTPLSVDLADQTVRRLLEHAARIAEIGTGVELMNR